MGLRAFTRHAVEKELTLRDNYRRLRILYNRIMLFGTHPYYSYYSYWAAHEFQTILGPRRFVCTTVYPDPDTEKEFMEFYYMKDDQYLFKMGCNREHFSFMGKYEGLEMTEQEAWLAIYELEELSYKELEVFNDKRTTL